jgi:hypothetical protein
MPAIALVALCIVLLPPGRVAFHFDPEGLTFSLSGKYDTDSPNIDRLLAITKRE